MPGAGWSRRLLAGGRVASGGRSPFRGPRSPSACDHLDEGMGTKRPESLCTAYHEVAAHFSPSARTMCTHGSAGEVGKEPCPRRHLASFLPDNTPLVETQGHSVLNFGKLSVSTGRYT